MTVKTLLIKNYDNTYISNVEGNSIEPLILEDDTLIIEELRCHNSNKIKKLDGRLIMAEINYEYADKRIKVENIDGEEVIYLISDNPKYQLIKIHEGDQFRVWGLVSKIIKHAAYL